MNKNKPLTFKSVFNCSTICIHDKSLDSNVSSEQTSLQFEYCITTDTDSSYYWKKYLIHDTINVPKGASISFRAAANGNETVNAIQFKMTGYFEASGNIQYLLDPTGQRTDVPYECYFELFKDCASLLEPPELPATKIGNSGYAFMFRNCINLRHAPELPATTLADCCYYHMFQSCIELTQAPELPATTLADCCYYYMFSNCKSLTQAPVLPATTLHDYCYDGMFFGCISLTQAPDLLAVVLPKKCYAFMFDQCISLKRLPNFPDLILTAHKTALQSMFNNSKISSFKPLILTYDY